MTRTCNMINKFLYKPVTVAKILLFNQWFVSGQSNFWLEENAQTEIAFSNLRLHQTVSYNLPIQNIVFFCRILPIYFSLQLKKALACYVTLNVLPILSNCLNQQEGAQNCNVIVIYVIYHMVWDTANWHGLSFPIPGMWFFFTKYLE